MRTLRIVLPVLAAVLFDAGAALALEKAAAALQGREPQDDWAAGASCTISYYNVCNGWVWAWSGWSDGDIVGFALDPCCDENGSQLLLSTNQNLWWGAFCGPGHGYTGILSIREVDDNGCPGTVLASQPFCPRSGDNVVMWNLPVSGPVMLTAEVYSAYSDGLSLHWATDRPAAGPTGPQACGVCYPIDRVTHSFYFGRADTPLCPGSPFYDGVCNAELYRWSAAFACPTEVRPSTWASIKVLYRSYDTNR